MQQEANSEGEGEQSLPVGSQKTILSMWQTQINVRQGSKSAIAKLIGKKYNQLEETVANEVKTVVE